VRFTLVLIENRSDVLPLLYFHISQWSQLSYPPTEIHFQSYLVWCTIYMISTFLLHYIDWS